MLNTRWRDYTWQKPELLIEAYFIRIDDPKPELDFYEEVVERHRF